MHYKIIRTINELSAYRFDHDELVNMHADDEYYYYLYGNLLSLWPFLERQAVISIILVFEKDTLIAIAPFQVKRRHIIYFSNRFLQFLGDSNHSLGSKYGSIIYASTSNKSDVDKIIIEALQSDNMPAWDEVLFNNIKQCCEYPLSGYFDYQRNSVSSCYRTPTKYTEEEFLHKYLKRKSRYKLSRSKKDLINDFDKVEFIRISDFDEETFERISILHADRQRFKRNNSQYKDYYSLFDNQLERNSFLMLTKWLSENKMLSLYLLKVNDNIISFLYCIDIHSISNVLIMAFDIKYHNYSPSKLLALYAFENQYKRGELSEMDYLEDTNLFKKQLCPIEIERISINAVNNAALLSRIKWCYIKSVKRIANKFI